MEEALKAVNDLRHQSSINKHSIFLIYLLTKTIRCRVSYIFRDVVLQLHNIAQELPVEGWSEMLCTQAGLMIKL